MAAIRKIQIHNFRSVRQMSWNPSPGINCLIGPGDSGKSTVLDAIDLCLCARRSVPITDADFHDLNVANLSPQTRSLLGRASRTRKNGWFKSISWMEHVTRHIVCPVWQQCTPEFQARIDNAFRWAAHG